MNRNIVGATFRAIVIAALGIPAIASAVTHPPPPPPAPKPCVSSKIAWRNCLAKPGVVAPAGQHIGR